MWFLMFLPKQTNKKKTFSGFNWVKTTVWSNNNSFTMTLQLRLQSADHHQQQLIRASWHQRTMNCCSLDDGWSGQVWLWHPGNDSNVTFQMWRVQGVKTAREQNPWVTEKFATGNGWKVISNKNSNCKQPVSTTRQLNCSSGRGPWLSSL